MLNVIFTRIMARSNKAILLTANQIKREIGIPLLLDEEQKEKRYLESLSV